MEFAFGGSAVWNILHNNTVLLNTFKQKLETYIDLYLQAAVNAIRHWCGVAMVSATGAVIFVPWYKC